MFSVVTDHADFKRNVLAVASITTDEVLFVAENDGIFFYGMDPSHVALALIDWPSCDFESYKWDEKVRIGVHVGTLSKIVKRLSPEASVEISVKNENMMLKSDSTQFKMRLLDVNEQRRRIPQIPATVEFTVDAKSLAKIIGDVEVSSDYINFKANGDKLSFAGKGDGGEVEITTDIVSIFGDEYKGGASASYSIEYLKPFVDNMEGDMTLKFAEEKPATLDCGHVRFIVAPRVGQ